MTDPDRLIRLGVFGAPHGVRGELRLKSDTEEPGAIAAYGPLTDAMGRRRFDLKIVRPLKAEMLVVRVEGVATREAAEALTGIVLHVRRHQLPPPGPDEYYYSDLVGLTASTAEGELLGRVIGVDNFGAGDVLEIAPEMGETILLPFSRDVVTDVRFDEKLIVVAPPVMIE